MTNWLHASSCACPRETVTTAVIFLSGVRQNNTVYAASNRLLILRAIAPIRFHANKITESIRGVAFSDCQPIKRTDLCPRISAPLHHYSFAPRQSLHMLPCFAVTFFLWPLCDATPRLHKNREKD